MQKKIEMENIQSPESIEKDIEKTPQKKLEKLESNTAKEEETLSETESRTEKSDPALKKEIAESGVLVLLGDKIKKNKLIRAAVVGLSLYSANPAFASNLDNISYKSSSLNSAELSPNKNLNLTKQLNQLGNMSDLNKKELEKVYMEAPEEAKRIILDELEKGIGLSYEKILDSNEDVNLLILQQKVIDLQNSGEIAPRKKGGAILPLDKEHSEKTAEIEFTNDTLAENDGKQKITIESASENQIRAWVNYLKNPEKAMNENKKWEEENKKGWQNIYPERNPAGHNK